MTEADTPAAAEALTEAQLKFHLEEYRLLRGDINSHIKLRYDTFIWGTLASGAIAAWLFANAAQLAQFGTAQARVAWFIPLAVASVACLGFYHFDTIISNYGRYSIRLEHRLAASELGWDAANLSYGKRSNAAVSNVRFAAAWAIILLADLSLAIFVR